ncbi:MAG: ribosome-associated translation inhibitor RaiA [Rhodovarius sp.]|nr:ribosome-associated translation inhibitor RaiA [Rhodovarius sp.]MDW8316190.1 ribosome-associated translation inhibitor RaiA [Rhodovarius sp.]
MHITVAGKSVDTGEALRFHVEQGLNSIAEKYFVRALEARVVFSRSRGRFSCDINMHAGRNLIMRGEGQAPDAHRAFDMAAEHLGKRLRRYRRRVNEHARGQAHLRDPAVLAARNGRARNGQGRPDAGRGAAPRELLRPGTGGEEEASWPEDKPGGYPAVIAERPESVMQLTVSEAVLRLETAPSPVLMFRNRATGLINVVYRRQDGHVGWLDPGQS